MEHGAGIQVGDDQHLGSSSGERERKRKKDSARRDETCSSLGNQSKHIPSTFQLLCSAKTDQFSSVDCSGMNRPNVTEVKVFLRKLLMTNYPSTSVIQRRSSPELSSVSHGIVQCQTILILLQTKISRF